MVAKSDPETESGFRMDPSECPFAHCCCALLTTLSNILSPCLVYIVHILPAAARYWTGIRGPSSGLFIKWKAKKNSAATSSEEDSSDSSESSEVAAKRRRARGRIQLEDEGDEGDDEGEDSEEGDEDEDESN